MGRAEDATLLHCMGIKIDHPDIFPSIDSRLSRILYTGPAAALHPSSKLHSQYLFHSACLLKAWRGMWPQWDGEEVTHRGYLCVQQGLGNFSFKFLSFSLPDIVCEVTLAVLLGFWSINYTSLRKKKKRNTVSTCYLQRLPQLLCKNRHRVGPKRYPLHTYQ